MPHTCGREAGALSSTCTHLSYEWAGIHRRNEHETRWKAQRHVRPGYRNCEILQGLPQQLQNVARKFWKFIEKQNAVMRKTDFARPRRSLPSSDEPGI